VSTFRASVAAGESGPVIVLTGEVDITNAAELSELVTGQLASQTRHLTIDVDRLDFTDMAAIRVFILAARTLRQRGAELVLLHPQRALVRVLGFLGVDEVIAIRGRTQATPEPEP
jgi:anti-sigma B factor antagonist